MKRRHYSSQKRSNLGLSLIELMVSLTIGLILVVAILAAYVNTSGASKIAEAQGRMNEDAQVALSILAQQLRMAGDNPKRADYASTTPTNPAFGSATFAIRACDATFSNISTASDIQSLTCGASGADSIAISYEADPYNTVKTTGGAATDCLGVTLPSTTGIVNKWNGVASVPTSVTYTVADNRFYVGTSGVITVPSLYCKGNGTGGTPQPLVENIEDMQFIFGTALATATTTMSVAGYLDAAGILSNAGLAALPDDQTRWSKVLTVRVCVLARSEQVVAPDAASAKYVSCPTNGASTGTLTDAPDLRLRRAYSTTVVLRNRVTP
jgi:type IV pilus assembly protein PilW